MKETNFFRGEFMMENKNILVHKPDMVGMGRTHKVTLISKHDNFSITVTSS